MRVNTTPCIFILDLDNTIIGDCKYQSELYGVIKTLKKNKIKSTTADESLIKAYKKKSKLIRPYFVTFINTIRKYYPNSSIFIYTASQKEWAIKEIEIIEKSLDIKFDRPLFTRDDCIMGSDMSYKKSIKKILPKILISLKKNKKPTTDINNRVLIIDDRNVYIDYNDNLLICPAYNYILFDNIWEKIPINAFKHDGIRSLIKSLIKYEVISPINLMSYETNIKKMKNMYKWLYNKCNFISKYNNNYENDIFWKRLTRILLKTNITKFDYNTVKYIKDNI
jgi:hypothetical protein